MIFKTTDIFLKQWKKLQKKYRSLDHDLEIFKKAVKVCPKGNSIHDNIITQQNGVYIMKARLLCRAAKSSSFRVIYAYHENSGQIEMIEFLEIYAKNQQENHSTPLIQEYLDQIL